MDAERAPAASDSLLAGHYPSAVPNQVRGTQDAVTHLLGLGHRTVHHIAGAADSYPSEVRRSTWQRCLATAGREVPEPWMGDWSPMSGYLIGREIAGKLIASVRPQKLAMTAGLSVQCLAWRLRFVRSASTGTGRG